jgi:NAD(P)-dependent dehydrogenase (short-subunit alcohol dehydrogenase family)
LVDEKDNPTPRGKKIIAGTPMGRYGKPEELVGAIVYLCSDAASFVTGSIIPIDGGYNAYSGV